MAYSKVIRSGDLIERWDYQLEPLPRVSVPRKSRMKREPRPRRKDAIRACKRSFQRLVQANLVRGFPPALVTLTIHDENIGIAEAYTLFAKFGRRVRETFGGVVSYIAVPEFQKRGAVHFHVLMFGLSDDIFIHERRTRTIAKLWGVGFVDVARTNGNAALSGYLSKYMSKAMHDKRLIGKRAYSASRNVKRPSVINTAFSIGTMFDDWGIGVDNSPVHSFEYDTMHLGRCVYRQYLLEPS